MMWAIMCYNVRHVINNNQYQTPCKRWRVFYSFNNIINIKYYECMLLY